MKGLVLVKGVYHVDVHYKRERQRRSTRTGHRVTAERKAKLWFGRREQLRDGSITLPPGVDPWDFVFDGVTEAATADFAGAAAAPVSLDDFQKNYVASLGPPLISEVFAATQAIYLGHFARFRRETPDVPKALKDWKPEHIERYRLWRLSPKGWNGKKQPVRALTVKKEVSSFRKMFDRARRQGLIERNPVHDLEVIPDDAPDDTFRTTEEIEALEKTGHLTEEELLELRSRWLLSVREVEEIKALLWGCAQTHYMVRPGDMSLLMHIAGDTAIRLGEIAKLTVLDLVLYPEEGAGVITARSRKQSRKVKKKKRDAPIDGDLVQRLADWVNGITGRRLFHESGENAFRMKLYRTLDAATKGTKYYGIRPHLLRHAFRTNMDEAGVDDSVTDAITGHTTREMSEHYKHMHVKRLVAGMQAYSQARARAAAEVAAKQQNVTET